MSNYRKPPRVGTQSLPFYIVVPAFGLVGTFAYAYYSFLDEAPFTKRKRLLATSPSWERQLGDREYQSLLKRYKKDILPPTHPASITVQRVGSRIAAAASNFEKQNLPPSSRSSSKYTYTVVRSEMANAFVLPNNHVFVLSGLFQYAKDEDELAAVIGHEMAHNLARHAGEKISGNILMSIMARVVLIIDPSGVLYSIFVPAVTLLHDLPHSRDAEVEADHIGIHLAADACYDPKAAKRVFHSMKEGETKDGKKTSTPPEFISTHPSYDTRLQNFDLWMADARAKFEVDSGMKCRQIRQEMKQARREAFEKEKRRQALQRLTNDRGHD